MIAGAAPHLWGEGEREVGGGKRGVVSHCIAGIMLYTA